MYNNHFAVNLKHNIINQLYSNIKLKNIKVALDYFAWSLLEHQQELTS